MDTVTKEKVVSVTISCALFAGSFTLNDLAMQALVWLCRVQFREISFGVVWFSASYLNLRQPCTLKRQI